LVVGAGSGAAKAPFRKGFNGLKNASSHTLTSGLLNPSRRAFNQERKGMKMSEFTVISENWLAFDMLLVFVVGIVVGMAIMAKGD
jgi:hypothetical protein